jgi:ATP/maltotriose-dependent transcriptional regulator MalT
MREEPRRQLLALVHECAEGAGGIAVVQGVGGMGKSTVMREALVNAEKRGLATFSSAVRQQDIYSPLAPLLRAFGAPRLLDDSPTPNTSAELDEALSRLERLAITTPIVIAIDDVQWIDHPTSVALISAVDELTAAPVLWMFASRPVAGGTPASSMLSWLTERANAGIELKPLDDAEVGQLMGSILKARPGKGLSEIGAHCGGNPYLITQFLRAMVQQDKVEIADGVATLRGDLITPSQLGLMSLGLDQISPTAHRLVSAASVFGRPFTLHEASALSGLTVAQAVSGSDEAMRAGALIAYDETRLTFSHEVTREHLYQSLAKPVRNALHLEATRLPSSNPHEPASHLDKVAAEGQTIAHGILLETSSDLENSSPSVAADLLIRSLGIMPRECPDRPALVVRAIRLLVSSGRLDEAEAMELNEVDENFAPEHRARALLGIAESLKHRGKDREVVALTSRALDLPDLPDYDRADLLALRAHALMNDARIETEARDVAQEALKVAESSGNTPALVFALIASSVVAHQVGELAEALQHAEAAVAFAENDPASRRLHAERWLARVQLATDDHVAAAVTLNDGQRAATALGTAWTQPMWHYDRAELCLARGKVTDALVEAETGLRVADVLSAHALAVPLLTMQARCQALMGEIEAAEESLARAGAWLESGVVANPGILHWTQVNVAMARGEHDALPGLIARATPRLPGRRSPVVANGSLGIHAIRALLVVDERKLAGHIARLHADVSADNPAVASRRGWALHAAGLIEGDVTRLKAARAAYKKAGRKGMLGWVALDLGNIHAAQGRTDLASESHTLAARIFQEQGAIGASRAVTAKLEVSRPVTAPEEVDDPWLTLTKSEMRVMKLIVSGMTNREVADKLFLSPHTVDTHLRHVFEKVGVNSRIRLCSLYFSRYASLERSVS